MRFLPAGMRARLLLLVVIPLFPVLVLVVYDAFTDRNTSIDRAKSDLRRVSRLAAMIHDDRLDDAQLFLSQLADDPRVRGADPHACQLALAHAIRMHAGYPNVGVVNADGTIGCSAVPPPANARLSPNDVQRVVDHALETQEFAIGDFTIGPVSHRPVILTGYPIRDLDGRTTRVLVVSLDFVWLSDLVTNALLPSGASMTVIDRSGRIVARHPDAISFVGTSVHDLSLYRFMLRVQSDSLTTGMGVDSVERLYAFARIRGPDAAGMQFVVAGLPLGMLSTDADETLREYVILLTVVFGLSALAAWRLGGITFVAPLHRMLEATRRVANGDLSARVVVDQNGGEMALLAAGFDQMADALEQRSRNDADASESMRQQRDYVRHIIDTTPALVCGILPDGTTTFANPAVEATTGYTAQELIGKNWWRIFYPGDSYTQVEQLFVDFERGPVRDYEMDLTTARGETRTISWNSLNKTNAAGDVVEVIGFGMDITERKQAEHERDRFEIQLRQAQKLESIGQLAAGIAHEINTPTQYIGDNMRFLSDSFCTLEQIAHLLRRLTEARDDQEALALLHDSRVVVDAPTIAYVTEEIPRAIAQSLEGVQHVARIVRAMKEFSSSGSAARAPLDVNEALQNTVTVTTSEWKYVADVVMDFAPDLPPVIGHGGELNQVFLNLIVNAAYAIGEATDDARRGKGLIELTTRRVGASAEIRISDTGVGIPNAIQARVFDPFFTTKPVGKGSGQGLAICYSVIVERHQGSIAFETAVGRGTTFIVTLPLALDTSAVVESAA